MGWKLAFACCLIALSDAERRLGGRYDDQALGLYGLSQYDRYGSVTNRLARNNGFGSGYNSGVGLNYRSEYDSLPYSYGNGYDGDQYGGYNIFSGGVGPRRGYGGRQYSQLPRSLYQRRQYNRGSSDYDDQGSSSRYDRYGDRYGGGRDYGASYDRGSYSSRRYDDRGLSSGRYDGSLSSRRYNGGLSSSR